jgi:hypothetical protein
MGGVPRRKLAFGARRPRIAADLNQGNKSQRIVLVSFNAANGIAGQMGLE